MLIYLALSEHIAPLGGIHDVFIKVSSVNTYAHAKEEAGVPSTSFGAQTQKNIFSGHFLE